MNYTSDFLVREQSDENGHQLCKSLEVHLTYLSSNGLNDFHVCPIVNHGHTAGLIVTAKGIRPCVFGAREAFEELTGINNTEDIAEFLSGDVNHIRGQIEQASEQERQQPKLVNDTRDRPMTYIADVIDREPQDSSGEDLGSFIARHMSYLSDHGVDQFLLVPIQKNSQTVSVIIAGRGQRPRTEREKGRDKGDKSNY